MSVQKTPTLDAIRKILKEISQNQKEAVQRQKEADRRQKEIDRQMKETDRRQKETDRQMKESDRKWDRRIQELWESKERVDRQLEATDRQLEETAREVRAASSAVKKAQDLFTNQWGRLIESLAGGNLVQLLYERGVDVDTLAPNYKVHQRKKDSKGRLQKELVCEIDLLARNGHESVAVEVKTHLSVKDINTFLDILNKYALEIAEGGRRLYGGVAYLRVQKGAEAYARRKGLFVVKVSGDNAKIMNKEGFKPKVFSKSAASL